MQYIFLDESGDLGFNQKKKNSRYFLITFVFTANKRPIEKTVEKIHKSLRKKVKMISGGVLHSVKEKPITRKRLLKTLAKCDVKIMTVCLNKSKVYTKLQNEKHILYNYVTNILIDRILTKNLVNKEEKIILVASKRETNKFFNLNFKNYLQNQAKNKHRLNLNVEIMTPGEEKSLQAVDFVSWSIFRKYEYGDSDYYKLIENCIVEENPLYP